MRHFQTHADINITQMLKLKALQKIKLNINISQTLPSTKFCLFQQYIMNTS